LRDIDFWIQPSSRTNRQIVITPVPSNLSTLTLVNVPGQIRKDCFWEYSIINGAGSISDLSERKTSDSGLEGDVHQLTCGPASLHLFEANGASSKQSKEQGLWLKYQSDKHENCEVQLKNAMRLIALVRPHDCYCQWPVPITTTRTQSHGNPVASKTHSTAIQDTASAHPRRQRPDHALKSCQASDARRLRRRPAGPPARRGRPAGVKRGPSL
jgi:hypothetical protein